jgi:hypothetical protein
MVTSGVRLTCHEMTLQVLILYWANVTDSPDIPDQGVEKDVWKSSLMMKKKYGKTSRSRFTNF